MRHDKYPPFTQDLTERYERGEITKEFWHECEWEVQKRLIELARRFGVDTSRRYFHHDIEYHHVPSLQSRRNA